MHSEASLYAASSFHPPFSGPDVSCWIETDVFRDECWHWCQFELKMGPVMKKAAVCMFVCVAFELTSC